MRMRATVERDNAVGTDDGGHRPAPVWQTLYASLPCFASFSTRKSLDSRIGEGRFVAVNELSMSIPAGTDITTEDRVTQIVDRQGAQLYGACRIDTVQNRREYLDVKLVRLERGAD